MGTPLRIIALLLASALLGGTARANYEAGLRAYNEGDFATAMREYKADGSGRALYAIGQMHADGRGVKRADGREAARWYRKAAEQGYARAQYTLGMLAAVGKDVPPNKREAVRWFRGREARRPA